MFIVLFCFSRSSTTKCMSVNNKPFMARPTLIDLNIVKLIYFPLMSGLDKCSGSCNGVNELSSKIGILSETKHVNVKVFNMITQIE